MTYFKNNSDGMSHWDNSDFFFWKSIFLLRSCLFCTRTRANLPDLNLAKHRWGGKAEAGPPKVDNAQLRQKIIPGEICSWDVIDLCMLINSENMFSWMTYVLLDCATIIRGLWRFFKLRRQTFRWRNFGRDPWKSNEQLERVPPKLAVVNSYVWGVLRGGDNSGLAPLRTLPPSPLCKTVPSGPRCPLSRQHSYYPSPFAPPSSRHALPLPSLRPLCPSPPCTTE